MEIVPRRARQSAFGQDRPPTPLDQLGARLSSRQVRRRAGSLAGKRLGDFGCGYEATIARSVLPQVRQAVLVDVALAPDLKSHPKVVAIEGLLPDATATVGSGSLDVVLCISVLEHLWAPLATLIELRRVLAPGGVCILNVPSWLGKWFLELSAFRLGLTTPQEIDDHKTYYDPRDLWPLLVRAGFVPHDIRCFRHKLGLNTFAVCRVGRTVRDLG